ncbi:hypothetical protein [Nannocystis radixulma]|uniref:Uncharacterized protein n=1 Tax=Nannocystis radixulma TaxID=2995305 RepID=A0ABT5BA81_9BACT|nr:hypothetical protein [Nannocystis radixulma]MDC0671044.1 hypothetical protein [Nannocystis radixulma]
MRLSIFSLPVLSVILACGPVQPGETDTDPAPTTTPGETDTGSPATTTTSPTTTGDDTTTTTTITTFATTEASPTTVDPTTTGLTTDGVETTTGTTDASTDTTDGTSTGGAPDVAFAAQFWAGGLDHLQVRMADLKDDFCVELRFARPGDVGPPELTLPTDWWYQGATVSQGAADCLDFMAPMPQAVGAESIAGVVAWDDQPFCPPAIDMIDVVVGFPPDQAWVPTEVTLTADVIPVDGC